MTSETEPYSDPLIDEVRRRRRDLFAECANDLSKLYEAILRRQTEHPDRMIRRPKRTTASG